MSMQIPHLSFDDLISRLRSEAHPSRQGYLAMYSSWFGGIIKDPQMMFVPIDDHMVHRGDAVFEAIKCVDGKIFGLDRHLERMARSAELIGLKIPFSLPEVREICVETVRAAREREVLLRLYASRGPGGFTTNPYECISSQFYLVITRLKPYSAEKYEKGVSAKVSYVSVKEGIFATVKSCNYLPNVMMKKEAVDSGVDFTVSKDEKGFLAEGSTENFALVSQNNELVVPGFSRTLRGVTAVRVMELAQSLVAGGVLSGVRNGHINVSDVFSAKEAFFLGTTIDCLPCTTFEGRKIGDGSPGPISRKLLELLKEDMSQGSLVTRVF